MTGKEVIATILLTVLLLGVVVGALGYALLSMDTSKSPSKTQHVDCNIENGEGICGIRRFFNERVQDMRYNTDINI